jgi:OOP family OmpA-OmpF porin
LLLLHEGSGGSSAPDAGLVSAMLTAIGDFARDSFDAQDDLERFQLGELTVYVESGPMAVLAVVVRGATPPDLHASLAETLEGVHRRFADDLREYNGDSAAFEIARDDLNTLLVASYRGAPKPPPRVAPKPRPAWRRPALWGLAALLVGGGVWLEVTRRENARWHAFFDDLRAQPGIVVTQVASKDGAWIVEGLRDPFAPSLETLLEKNGFSSAGVRSALRPFVSLEPVFVQRRAIAALQPPSSVRLRLENGVLYAEGRATPAWLARAKNLVPALSGVSQLVVDGLRVNETKSERP